MDITTEEKQNSDSKNKAENPESPMRTEEALLTKDVKNIKGAYLSIVLAAGAPCIIVASICGVLLGLTFAHRVILEPGWPELRPFISPNTTSTSLLTQAESLGENGGSRAYYIQFNPSSLTTIASWTGKVIPYLSSATMALAAFFAADHIREKSRTGRDEELLTPHQLSLLLGLLSGGAEQLWDTVRYRYRRGRHLPKPIPLVFTTLSITILLGFLIPAVDTWFGIVTTPVQLTQLQTIAAPTKTFSRGLVSSCTNSANQVYVNGAYLPCTLETAVGGTFLLSDDEAYRIMNGISQTHTVRAYSPDTSKVFYYLSDAASSTEVDFKASTFAVTTECELISSKCGIGGDDPQGTTFNCTPSFSGSLTWPGPAILAEQASPLSIVGIEYFGDPGLTNNFSTTPSLYSPQNPLYFGTWATGQQATRGGEAIDIGIAPGALGFSWVLNCTSTVYEVTYTWVNGTVTSFNTTLANGTVGGIFSAGFAAGFGTTALENTAIIAGFSNTSAELANTTATYFSQNSLALSIGAMDLRPNILEQSRTLISLTRVPLVPFYILIALKLVYAFSTVLFALAVMIWAHPSESQEVKTRLSIKGLVAASFEPDKLKERAVGSVEEVFSEHSANCRVEKKKVGIVKTEHGGWTYVTTAAEVGEEVIGAIRGTAEGP